MTVRRIGWLCWLLAAGLLYFFENNTGTRMILTASWALPALSVGVAVAKKRQAAVSLTVPAEAGKGEACSIAVRPDRVPWMARLKIHVACRNLLTGEQWEKHLWAEGGDAPRVTVQSTSCGMVRCTVQAAVCDLFGLYVSPVMRTETAAVLIRPALFPVDALPAPAEGDSREDAPLRPGRTPGELYDVREYLPGDPVRQIHWKLSQKLDTVLIRQWGQAAEEETLLLFCPAPGEQAEILSRMAEMLLSLSRGLLEKGAGHTVCWQDAGEAGPVLMSVAEEADFSAVQAAFFAHEKAVFQELPAAWAARYPVQLKVDRNVVLGETEPGR